MTLYLSFLWVWQVSGKKERKKQDEAGKGKMEVRGNSHFPQSSTSVFVSAVRQLEQRALIRSSLRPIEIKTFFSIQSPNKQKGRVVHHPFQHHHLWSPPSISASPH